MLDYNPSYKMTKVVVVMLLLLLMLTYVQCHYNNNIRSLSSSSNAISYSNKNHFNNKKMKEILQESNPLKIVTRVPRSLYVGTFIGIESFIQTALVMLPIGLSIHISHYISLYIYLSNHLLHYTSVYAFHLYLHIF